MLNRIFPAALLLLTAPSAFAFECSKPVDPNKALIFIDVNFGLTEIQLAEVAACDRGETFIRLPGYHAGEEVVQQDLARLKKVRDEMAALRTRAHSTACSLPISGDDIFSEDPEASNEENAAAAAKAKRLAEAWNNIPSDPRCDPLIRRFNVLNTEADRLAISTGAFLSEVKSTQGDNFVYDMLRKGMVDLARRGIRPVTIIISGHSGGDAFGGRYGDIMMATVQKLILDGYQDALPLLGDLRSLYLWGCNTLNPYAPEKWTSVFPTLDLIVGFQGSAPSNLNAASWGVLDGILHREAGIFSRVNSFRGTSDVKAAFDGITGISGTVAAVYLHDRTNDRKWFYERIQEKSANGRTNWVERASELLAAKDCTPVLAQVKRDQAYIDSILAGITPISEQTASGPLREIYSRARRNDYCRATAGYPHSADRIGLLLFWHDTKKNAVRAISNEMYSLDAHLTNALDHPEAVPGLMSSPALLSDLRKFAEQFSPKSVATIDGLSYAAVRTAYLDREPTLVRIERAVSSSSEADSKLKTLVASAREWQNLFRDTVLVPKTECMNFIQWHEYFENTPPAQRARFSCHRTL